MARGRWQMARGRWRLRRGALMAAPRGPRGRPPPCCPPGRGATPRRAASPSPCCGRCRSRRGGSAGADRPYQGRPSRGSGCPGGCEAAPALSLSLSGGGLPRGRGVACTPRLASPFPSGGGPCCPCSWLHSLPRLPLAFFIASLRSLLLKWRKPSPFALPWRKCVSKSFRVFFGPFILCLDDYLLSSVVFLPSQQVQQDGFPGLAAPAVAKAAGSVWAGRLELLLTKHKHRGGRAGVPGHHAAAGRHAGAHPQVEAGAGAARVSAGVSWKSLLLCGASQFCWCHPKADQACWSSTMVFLSSDAFSFLLAAFRAGSFLALGCYQLVWEQDFFPGQCHFLAENPWSLVQVPGVGR